MSKKIFKMERFTENYNGQEFDLIVIGGGITGASVAYEAASRGMSVALVEKNDFGSATSAASSKMIHGGLRYLAKLELKLVRESLRERRVLTNIAPNFVHPAPFIFSMYKTDKTPAIAYRIGMLLYEILSFDRTFLWDKSKKMPGYKTLSPQKVKELVPQANTDGLKGAHLYYDCSNHSPERFTLGFLKSAVHYGAKIANYTEMTDFIIENNEDGMRTVKGIKILDKLSNTNLDLKGKLIVNCAGPWADIVLGKTHDKNDKEQLRRSEGIHFVTKKFHDKYIFAASSQKNQHFFVIPYRNHSLIGTTDKEFLGNPDKYCVTKESIEELLEKVNSSFGNGEKITYDDLKFTYGGLRPLVEDQTEDVYNSSRKYEVTDEKKNGINCLFTVEGGKYTTSRSLAKGVINKAFAKLENKFVRSNTRHQYLVGSEIKNLKEFVEQKQKQYPMFNLHQMDFLVNSYGTEIDKLMVIFKSDENLQTILNEDGENLAQVVYAIRFEMAKTLNDIMLRRTGLGQLGFVDDEVLNKIVQVAVKELNWSTEQIQEQIDLLNKKLEIPQ